MNKTLRAILSLTLAQALAAPARAGLVATDAAAAGDARARIQALLERPALAAELAKMGLAPQQAAARVDALNDAEVHALAGPPHALVAGGGFANQTPVILVGVLLVLLVLVL